MGIAERETILWKGICTSKMATEKFFCETQFFGRNYIDGTHSGSKHGEDGQNSILRSNECRESKRIDTGLSVKEDRVDSRRHSCQEGACAGESEISAEASGDRRRVDSALYFHLHAKSGERIVAAWLGMFRRFLDILSQLRTRSGVRQRVRAHESLLLRSVFANR